MKITKTLKTLKFWSKKKKKKKINTIHHNPPPPPCCCNHHHHHRHHDSSQSLQPSAPPLPSWLDYEEQTYNQHLLTSEVKISESSGLPISYQAQEHDISDSSRSESGAMNPPSSSASGEMETGCSYQQYMVKKPVYGVPVLPSRTAERSAGAVGCVFNIGSHLFRCFFPCFRTTDVQNDFNF